MNETEERISELEDRMSRKQNKAELSRSRIKKTE